MRELDDLIQHENENSTLDFKSEEYHKDNHHELIKDIVSMANAKAPGTRYIIIGIKISQTGEKEFIGLEKLKDDARYQQLIQENVEPDIDFQYKPYFKNVLLGIFEIRNCINPPYLLKKKYKNLNLGEGYIRKGSHKVRITREDLDDFYSKKISESKFSGKVKITPIVNGIETFSIPTFKKSSEYPSEKAEERIRNLIGKKKEDDTPETLNLAYGYTIKNPDFVNSIPKLMEDLENVKNKYFSQDMYYFFQVDGTHLNFELLVDGSDYIEDGYVEVIFQKSNELKIAKEVYRSPQETGIAPSSFLIRYPDVKETEKEYVASSPIGDVRHKVPMEIFEEPLNLVLHESSEGLLNLKIKLHGKNINDPIEKEISLEIV